MARHVTMKTPDRGDEMTNALDVFREQQDAAKKVHGSWSNRVRLKADTTRTRPKPDATPRRIRRRGEMLETSQLRSSTSAA
jgi:hypothetical protein